MQVTRLHPSQDSTTLCAPGRDVVQVELSPEEAKALKRLLTRSVGDPASGTDVEAVYTGMTLRNALQDALRRT